VRHRLQVYHTLTAPLITHYESTGHLLTFDVKQGKKDWLRLKPLLSSHRPL
jgi:adenylate kinase family enzyme